MRIIIICYFRSATTQGSKYKNERDKIFSLLYEFAIKINYI